MVETADEAKGDSPANPMPLAQRKAMLQASAAHGSQKDLKIQKSTSLRSSASDREDKVADRKDGAARSVSFLAPPLARRAHAF